MSLLFLKNSKAKLLPYFIKLDVAKNDRFKTLQSHLFKNNTTSIIFLTARDTVQ